MPKKDLAAAVFPGQGVQEHLSIMCRTLLESDEGSEETFEKASKFLGMRVLQLCLEGSKEELNSPQNLQPAVATASVAAYESMQKLGFRPDIVAGHSLGEYPALYAAGSITLESMCRLVRARAVYMEEANNEEPGAMAAILSLSLDPLKKIAKDAGVDIGLVNVLKEKREQIVLSGGHPELAKAMEMVTALKSSEAMAVAKRRINAIKLDIPYAAHSRRMRKAQTKLAAFIKRVPIYDPQLPVVANGTGRYIKTAQQIRTDLPRQLTRAVQWDETVRFMEAEGVTAIYEVGAGTVLSGLNRQIVSPGVEVIPFDPSRQFYEFGV